MIAGTHCARATGNIGSSWEFGPRARASMAADQTRRKTRTAKIGMMNPYPDYERYDRT